LPQTSVGIKQDNKNKWELLNSGLHKVRKFEQWPAPGTTTTGGWVETAWSQSAPYNNFCPMDLVSGNRSVAGCPSVAISMIINYINTINGTRLVDSDRYHHNYGGNNYWIDDEKMTKKIIVN